MNEVLWIWFYNCLSVLLSYGSLVKFAYKFAFLIQFKSRPTLFTDFTLFIVVSDKGLRIYIYSTFKVHQIEV